MKPLTLKKSEPRSENSRALYDGMRDGIPIGLGYLAVSFSLGIVARGAGLTAFQGFLASALVNASAGEYAGFMMIAADAPYLEMVIVILIANARYFLMSCAMSQRLSPETRLPHRLLLGNYITDEFFGLAISRPGYLNPRYSYGAILVAAPCWALGTAIGVIAGNLLPLRVVSALGVALYGMFLAIIVPPSRRNKVIAGIILICFASSYAASRLPLISEMSAGTRTIVLTVAISALAALLFPVRQGKENGNDA